MVQEAREKNVLVFGSEKIAIYIKSGTHGYQGIKLMTDMDFLAPHSMVLAIF